MHYSSLKKSDRLKKAFNLLRDKKVHTSIELHEVTGSISISSIVSELRRNGLIIDCWLGHIQPNGSKVYYYLYICNI